MPTIDTLRPDQLEDSSAVLARAFDDDPVFRYLYPTPRRRQWSTGNFLQAIVRDGLPFGEVWAAIDDGAVVGTAGWLPEGTYPPSRRRAVRQLVAAWQALLTPHTFRDGLRYLTEDAVLGRLDTTGVPAYLETSTEGNVAWYRHHGFEVQREVRPVPAGPPVWTMWREPKT